MKKTFLLLFFGLFMEAYCGIVESQLECLKNWHVDDMHCYWDSTLERRADDLVSGKDISSCHSPVKVMKLKDAIVTQQRIKRRNESTVKSKKHNQHLSGSCEVYTRAKKNILESQVLLIHKNVGCSIEFNGPCVIVLCIYN